MSWVAKSFFRKNRPSFVEMRAHNGDKILFKIIEAKQVGDTLILQLEQVKEPIAIEV